MFDEDAFDTEAFSEDAFNFDEAVAEAAARRGAFLIRRVEREAPIRRAGLREIQLWTADGWGGIEPWTADGAAAWSADGWATVTRPSHLIARVEREPVIDSVGRSHLARRKDRH